jgi:hypothetical protein
MKILEKCKMNFHKFLKVKLAEAGIELTTAAELMNINYKTLHTRIMSGKLSIEELLQLSDIYGFTLDDMKGKIEYKRLNLEEIRDEKIK